MKSYLTILFCLTFFLFIHGIPTFAQSCALIPACNPGTTSSFQNNLAFGIGIRQVQLHTLNSSSAANAVGGTQNGYQDFSCQAGVLWQGATLTATIPYAFTVTTNPNVAENVRAWLDLNNDGSFSAGELVFTSNNALSHTGTITVPAGTVTGQAIRLRIVSELAGAAALPVACGTLEYGQAEDYYVVVQPFTGAPIPAFSASSPVTCSGTVQFQDLSAGSPTSWLWKFGDGSTSAQQHPSHTYTNPGTYPVSLKTCNASGCDSLSKTSFITYNAQVPAAAACSPPTQSYCCGYGIYQFSFGSINNSSAGGSAGYQDFTCTVPAATFTEGIGYPVSLQTSATPQNTYIWIDLNNDGNFSASELVYTALSQVNPAGILTLPTGGLLNTPLRLRIWTDQSGSATPTGCTPPQLGQVEDYAIKLRSAAGQPVALFTADTTGLANCGGVVSFSNLSNGTNSWRWSFGDGDSSTLQNPVHVYSNKISQTYTVTLVACNAVSCDTTTHQVQVRACPKVAYCINPYPALVNRWMKKVRFGTIASNITTLPFNYTDLTHLSTDLIRGSVGNAFSVELYSSTPAFVNLIIWADWNQDGIFSPSEKVFRSTQIPQGGATGFSGTINVPPIAQLGTTRIRFMIDNGLVPPLSDNPCIFNSSWTIQDFTIRIIEAGKAPVAGFTSDVDFQTNHCSRKVTFSHQSATAYSFQWDFGDGTGSTLPNPDHTYAAVSGNYNVRLIACNAAGCDTVTKSNYVQIAYPCQPYCIPANPAKANSDPFMYLRKVEVNGQANNSGPEPKGYSNFTAQTLTQLTLGATVPFKAEVVSVIDNRPVKVWIDLDHSNSFEPGELVVNIPVGVQKDTLPSPYPYPALVLGYDTVISVPSTAQLGPTRMRVKYSWGDAGPCDMTTTIEAEDYTVMINSNGLAPIAGFKVTPDTECSGIARFSDLSQNGATSWLWDFGDPASGSANASTLQNPVHNYNVAGNYTVRLKVCNAQNCDSVTMVNFIRFNPNQAKCDAVIMPISGAQTVTSCNGTFYDPGGPVADYPNFSSSTLTIAPLGADSVTVYFDQFSLSFPDMLYVYDGPGVNSPVIGQYTGGQLPNGGIITSTGGAITIAIASDETITEPGFAARWTCWSSTAPPKAFFTSDKAAICAGQVTFTDRSTNQPTSRLWRFGDGTTSTQQHPVHTYATTPGLRFFPVSLRVCNANGCDSIRYDNYVAITNPCYCPSFGNNLARYIKKIRLHDLTQLSQNDANGYGNYTHRIVELEGGKRYPLEIELEGNPCQRTSVWIDLNQDHLFTANEMVYTNTISGSCRFVSDSLLVPASILPGYTRMRVIDSPWGQPNACIAGLTGETEDYTIFIKQPTGLPENIPLATHKLEIYPNPSSGTFQVMLPEGAMHLEVNSLLGQRILSRQITNQTKALTLELPHLSPGVYLVQVRTTDKVFRQKVVIQR